MEQYVSRSKRDDPNFAFMHGGEGSGYYSLLFEGSGQPPPVGGEGGLRSAEAHSAPSAVPKLQIARPTRQPSSSVTSSRAALSSGRAAPTSGRTAPKPRVASVAPPRRSHEQSNDGDYKEEHAASVRDAAAAEFDSCQSARSHPGKVSARGAATSSARGSANSARKKISQRM